MTLTASSLGHASRPTYLLLLSVALHALASPILVIRRRPDSRRRDSRLAQAAAYFAQTAWERFWVDPRKQVHEGVAAEFSAPRYPRSVSDAQSELLRSPTSRVVRFPPTYSSRPSSTHLTSFNSIATTSPKMLAVKALLGLALATPALSWSLTWQRYSGSVIGSAMYIDDHNR